MMEINLNLNLNLILNLKINNSMFVFLFHDGVTLKLVFHVWYWNKFWYDMAYDMKTKTSRAKSGLTLI